MDHEEQEELSPSHSMGDLCIARFQPLNPDYQTQTYIHDKNSDVDDDLDVSESSEEEMKKDQSLDAISDSSSYINRHENHSSKTDASNTFSSSRSFHLEKIESDDIIEDKYGPYQGLRSKETGKQKYCAEVHGRKLDENDVVKPHFQVHDNERPYVCYICNKSFTQREHLELHIDSHSKIKLCCERCGQRFRKAEQLSKHLHIHSEVKTYKCQFWSKDCMKSSGLYSHIRNKPFSCAACKQTFARRQNLKGHLIKAHNFSDGMLTSLLPPKRKAYEYQKNTSLNMSSNKIHKMYKMPRNLNAQDKATDACKGAFGSKSNIRHAAVDSTANFKAGPISVHINALLYDQLNDLQGENIGDHKSIKISQFFTSVHDSIELQTKHSSEQHESENCDSITNTDTFSITQTNSSENRDKLLIECAGDNVKNSDFSRISDPFGKELLNAVNVGKDSDNAHCSSTANFDLESGIPFSEHPPYPCPYCEQKFSRRSNLNVHIQIHLGVKPFPCPTCNKNFNRKSNLKVHMAKVHNYDKNAVMEATCIYNALGDAGQNESKEEDGIVSLGAPMPILITDVAENKGQGKHLEGQSCHSTLTSLPAYKSTENFIDNNHFLFCTDPGQNYSASYESYSDTEERNENTYQHNSDHYMYPTEDNATYSINSAPDTLKENIFLSAQNNSNLLHDAQNTFQNKHSSELKTSFKKDDHLYKECDVNVQSQIPSKENQSSVTLGLKKSFIKGSVSKTHECKICGHKFSRRGNLMGHYKVHSGIRQFVCPICQKSFTRKSNLRVHLVKIHNMTVEVAAHLSELGKQQDSGAGK